LDGQIGIKAHFPQTKLELIIQDLALKLAAPLFFKKRPLAEIFLEKLEPIYGEVAGVVKEIDGLYLKIYEAGIFVASIATLKILSLDVERPYELADEFNDKWLDFICGKWAFMPIWPSNKR